MLWRVTGANENYCVLRGHKQVWLHCFRTLLPQVTLLQAVLQLNWTAGGDNIWTASADKSVGFWDALTGQRVRKMADHSNIVNAGLPVLQLGRFFALVPLAFSCKFNLVPLQ